MIGPKRFGEQFLDVMIGLVPVHQEFFLDDLAFFFDVGDGKFRMLVHVGEYIEQDVEVPVAGFGVVTGIFFAGKGVEITADTFDGLADLFGGAPVRAFEKEVFEKMRNASERPGFVPAANANPNADGDTFHVRHRCGDNAKTAGQRGDVVHN